MSDILELDDNCTGLTQTAIVSSHHLPQGCRPTADQYLHHNCNPRQHNNTIVNANSIETDVWQFHGNLFYEKNLPFLALVQCSPIGGVASNNFFFYYMETLEHSIFIGRFHFFLAYHLLPRGKNHQNIAHCFCRRRESNPGCLRSQRVRYPLLHYLFYKYLLDPGRSASC